MEEKTGVTVIRQEKDGVEESWKLCMGCAFSFAASAVSCQHIRSEGEFAFSELERLDMASNALGMQLIREAKLCSRVLELEERMKALEELLLNAAGLGAQEPKIEEV